MSDALIESSSNTSKTAVNPLAYNLRSSEGAKDAQDQDPVNKVRQYQTL